MKTWLRMFLGATLLFSAIPPVRAASDVGMEEMLFGEIPTVVTASKSEQSLNKAPAVMTVVTAEDIKRMGLRTLEEVLKRVAGFYMTSSTDWQTIGSRGMINDTNYHYLILYDGHSTGSVNGFGLGNAYVIPTLSNVKQIEIIRGPGSTMWGNEAALGIINVITKTGAEQKGIQVTSDYSSRDQQEMQNVMVGGETPDNSSNYLVSATYFDRMGWSENHANPNFGHYKTGSFNNASAWDPWNPSWELYGKVKAGQFSFLARDLNFSSKRMAENTFGRHGNRDYANSFVEIGHELPTGDASSLETKIFSDKTLRDRYPTANANPGDPGNANVENEIYEESGVGAETMWKGAFGTHSNFGSDNVLSFTKHELKIGARAVRTKVGPNKYLSMAANSETMSTAQATIYEKTKPGTDVKYAAYAEDQWSVVNCLDLFGGIRFDNDHFLSPRKEREIVPRAGLIFFPTNALTFKYMVDTADVRPQVNQEDRNNRTPAANQAPAIPYPYVQPEGIITHTINAMYAKNGLQSSLTVYDMYIRDYYAAGGLIGGLPSWSNNFGNLGEAHSRGVELELKKKVGSLELYGNYSYSAAKLSTKAFAFGGAGTTWFTDSHREWLAEPHQIYNLGANVDITPKILWNVHLRGWMDGREIVWTAPGTALQPTQTANLNVRKAGEKYVDTNLRFEDVFGWPLSVAVYSWNVFNTAGKEMLAPSTYGYRLEEPRTIGGNVSYKF